MTHVSQTIVRDTNAVHQVSARLLHSENSRYEGTGGVSRYNHSAGFVPAFLDTHTGKAYRSCFSDGRPAPMHLLDGLPGKLLIRNREELMATEGVIAGFLHCGEFFTRAEAAAALKGCFQA